jgi:hypothetical protein
MPRAGLPTTAAVDQTVLPIPIIKQYPGVQTASRRVKVKCPGKFFPALTPSEQKEEYEVEAVEFAERHKFAAQNATLGDARRLYLYLR